MMQHGGQAHVYRLVEGGSVGPRLGHAEGEEPGGQHREHHQRKPAHPGSRRFIHDADDSMATRHLNHGRFLIIPMG